MWPLLLPDAVCMARSLAELLSRSGAGFSPRQRVANHMTRTRTISATNASVTLDLDSTEVEVYRAKKQGVAYSSRG